DEYICFVLLPLAERTEHEVDVLPSAGGPADADPHTIEVRRPEGLHERVQPMVAGGASPPLDPERSEGEIDVVVAGNDTVHGDAALARKRSDRRAALVHERTWPGQQQRHTLVLRFGSENRQESDLPQPDAEPLGQALHDHGPGVVARAFVAFAGVPQPGHEPELAGQTWLALFGLVALLAGLFAGGALRSCLGLLALHDRGDL